MNIDENWNLTSLKVLTHKKNINLFSPSHSQNPKLFQHYDRPNGNSSNSGYLNKY